MTDFDALLGTLGRHEVAFIVVDGAAAIAHGSARLTQDLDIVYDRSPANLDRLVAALAGHKPYLRGVPPGLPFLWDRATLVRARELLSGVDMDDTYGIVLAEEGFFIDGGDTQIVGNFEYRISIFGPVTLAPFVDFGINKIVLPNQLKMNPDRVNELNSTFPQAGFTGQAFISPGTQKPRMSTGIEMGVMLPIVQAPFRIYWAYNPLIVREFLQPPIVADRSFFPNNTTFIHSIASFGQATPRRSATTSSSASRIDAGALMVMEIDTRSSGME